MHEGLDHPMTSTIKLQRPRTLKPSLYRRLVRRFRLLVATRPNLYTCYARARRLPFQITDKTQVLVDSYPRSANSFFEAAFVKAHGGRLNVAHHSHAAGQVLAGVKRGLPCIVLVRAPEAAIASFYDMNGGDFPIELCTREYVAFYHALAPVMDRLIIVETATLEARFYDLMKFLRDRYGLDVACYVIDGDTRKALFEDVDATGRARNGFSAERYSDKRSPREKQERQDQLAAIRDLISTPKNAAELSRAQSLYESFRTHAF